MQKVMLHKTRQFILQSQMTFYDWHKKAHKASASWTPYVGAINFLRFMSELE